MRFKKKVKNFTSISIVMGFTALASSGSVLADETFTFFGQSPNTFGNQWEYTSAPSGDFMASVSAWSTSGSFSTIEDAALAISGSDLRVLNRGESGSSPNHAMDNSGYTDFMLFEFRNAATNALEDVTLKSVGIGWWTNDSDLTVMRYTGAGDPSSSIMGNTISGLLGDGDWDRYDVNNAASDGNLGISTLSSRWIVGASFSNLDGKKDYVKIRSIVVDGGGSGTGTGVPLPASILLMAAGLPLVRRFQRPAQA